MICLLYLRFVLYILYFPSQFVIFLVSLIKNKNAFDSCTLSFSFSVLHDPTFKTAPPSPPSCSRAHLPLMPIVLSSPPSYFSLLLLHSLSLLSLCVFVSLSVNLSQLNLLNLALNYSLSLSLCNTPFGTQVECVTVFLPDGHQQSSRRSSNCWWWWW